MKVRRRGARARYKDERCSKAGAGFNSQMKICAVPSGITDRNSASNCELQVRTYWSAGCVRALFPGTGVVSIDRHAYQSRVPRYASSGSDTHEGMKMRPYKRASLIAKSILKMIEAGNGGSVEISMTTILLPATIFDDLLRDSPAPPATDGAERVRINGIYFERVSSRRRRKRKLLGTSV